MDTQLLVAIIAGCVTIVTVTLGYGLSKRKDREDERRKLKIQHYEEFTKALSQTVVSRVPQGVIDTKQAQQKFADTINTLIVVASPEVVIAVYNLLDEISESNKNKSSDNHDRLLTELIKAIREDIGVSNKGFEPEFRFHLRSAG